MFKYFSNGSFIPSSLPPFLQALERGLVLCLHIHEDPQESVLYLNFSEPPTLSLMHLYHTKWMSVLISL